MFNWLPQGLTWRECWKRLWERLIKDDVIARAAQLSFYFILGLFPFLLFLIATLGYFAETGTELRMSLLRYFSKIAPTKASALIHDIVAEISEGRSGGKLSFGLLAALWAASSGMDAMITTLNAAYGVLETRPWWKRRLVAVGLTVALAGFVLSALVLMLYGSHIALVIAEWFHLGSVFTSVWKVLQWFFVLGFVQLALGLLYFFGPNVKEVKWRWLIPGSMLALGLWLLISFGFDLYLHLFNAFSATYGSLGAVIVLLLWLFLTGIAILLGGEVNAVFENAAAEAGIQGAKPHGQKTLSS